MRNNLKAHDKQLVFFGILAVSMMLVYTYLYRNSYNDDKSIYSPLANMPPHYVDAVSAPVVRIIAYNEKVPEYLLANLDQYNRGAIKLSRKQLQSLKVNKQFGKVKVLSKLKPTSLQYKVIRNITDHIGGFHLSLLVTDRNHQPVNGCNFDARQLFQRPSPQVALCTVKELQNGTYDFECANNGVQCFNFTIIVRFCHYEAFIHSPRIRMWNHHVLEREYCKHTPVASEMVDPGLRWTLDANGHCEQLIMYNSPAHMLSHNQTCDCINTQFNDIYLVGTSHIRFFADFLMYTCLKKDFSEVVKHHGGLSVRHLHYHDWGFFSVLHENMQNI